MTAEEAVEYGLVDKVIYKTVRSVGIDMMNDEDEKILRCSFCGKQQEQVHRHDLRAAASTSATSACSCA